MKHSTRCGLFLLAFLGCIPAFAQATNKSKPIMTPGMRIKATTRSGTIVITAVDDLTRSYYWEGATRSAEMTSRGLNRSGGLDLFYNASEEMWRDHHGITRGAMEEESQDFKTVSEAMRWIRTGADVSYVYRDDGLIIRWGKVPSQKQLHVDVNQIYINGKKPRHLPGSHNERIVISVQPPNIKGSLTDAVAAKDISAVQNLLDKGSDPNTRNVAGIQVLSLAIGRGYNDIAQLLLNKGAAVNTRNEDGSTALLRAIEKGDLNLMRLLIDKGADVNVKAGNGNIMGMPPLLWVMNTGEHNQREMIEMLLKAGADVNASDDSLQMTPLTAAIMAKSSEIAQLMLDQGVEVDTRTWYGSTPLMMAAMSGNADIVKLLINKGANVNARDDNTRREYGRAQFSGDSETVKKIKKSGKLNTLHEDGSSVLDWAKLSQNKTVIDFLKQAGAKE